VIDKIEEENGAAIELAEEKYVVSSLVDWRTNNKGCTEVLVQWGGQWSHSRTWQPVKDVEHLQDDLNELLKKPPAQWSLKDDSNKNGKKKRKK